VIAVQLDTDPRDGWRPGAGDIFYFNSLRFTEFALSILSRHCPVGDRLLCTICAKPWRCPLVIWAVDWIITVWQNKTLGTLGPSLLDDLCVQLTLAPTPVSRAGLV
jgi:hypothetical protein